MALVTKTFTYEGGVRTAEIPAGTRTITMHIWGGAGGGGGDDLVNGGSGSSGHYVTVTNFDVTSYAGAKNIAVSVGGGGGAGQAGGGAAGGSTGKSLTNYSGGVGGPSGPQGTSGSGGGGGGASIVSVFDTGSAFDQTVLAIAGGGAGGGGGGRLSSGGPGSNTPNATSRSPGTLGENGASHTGDGAGAGAGGGGTDGGTGGSGDQGDIGGLGGRAGTNTIPAGGSEDNGSGITPGGAASGYYVTGTATGGANQTVGGDGRVVLIFNMPSSANYKVGGTWKEIDKIFNKISGAWKKVNAGYVKVSGNWLALFFQDIAFDINFAAFGDVNGNATSGTAGKNAPPVQSSPDSFNANEGGGGGGGRIAPPSRMDVREQWGAVGQYNQQSQTVSNAKYQGCSVKNSDKGSGSNPRVICTYFHARGEFDHNDLKADTDFSRDYLSDTIKIGYWIWAIPLVQWLKKHDQSTHWWPKFVRDTWRMIATTRGKEISYKMGARNEGSKLGKVVRFIGENGCFIIGLIARPFVGGKIKRMLRLYRGDLNLIR